jgi:hypothetical protein
MYHPVQYGISLAICRAACTDVLQRIGQITSLGNQSVIVTRVISRKEKQHIPWHIHQRQIQVRLDDTKHSDPFEEPVSARVLLYTLSTAQARFEDALIPLRRSGCQNHGHGSSACR